MHDHVTEISDTMSDSGFSSSNTSNSECIGGPIALENAAYPTNLSVIDIRDITESAKSLASAANLTPLIMSELMSKNVVFPSSSARFDIQQNGKTSKWQDVPASYGEHDVLIRSIPTLVLYDDVGLEIFDAITQVSEYYVTNAEEQILKDESDHIMNKYVGDGGVIIELGVG